ncbi:Alpha/Beta hydrolase protein [Delphinella strobiligena]|nr:Alpha/Beta hydrolase protein [Delphinella strobiligena]
MFSHALNIYRYIRLKVKVTFVRFHFWWRGRLPKAFPDSVFQIPSRDPKRTIKAHVYHSLTAPMPSPVLINFHGSGFILPMHGQDEDFCRKIAKETDNIVLDIQYSLAPEHPFPAAINDAEDVIDWVLGQPEKYDVSQISLSGFSAGANLALVQSGITFPKDTFRSLICFYPPCDLSVHPDEKATRTPDTSALSIPSAMEFIFNESYMPFGADPKDPRISPLYASVDKYPQNVLMITCARDSLCLEGEALAAKIEEAGGRSVIRRRMDECGHAWDKSAKGLVEEQARDEAYELAVQMLSL